MARGLLVGAAVVGLALVGGVVALADEDNPRRAPPGRSDRSSLPDIPLERRGGSLIEWTGEKLVVLGGAVHGDRGGTRWVADGAVFDPARNAWEDLPAPRVGALAQPTGAWTGTELLVMGTPCEDDLPVDEGPEGCDPGGVGLVALTPGAAEWRTVPVPDELRRAPRRGWLHLGGVVGDQVLVSAGVDLWLWEPDSGSVRAVPAPELGVDGLCAGNDRLVALDYRSGSPGDDARQAGGHQFVPKDVPTAVTLDPEAARLDWSAARRMPVADDAFEFASHACAGDGALVVRQAVGGRQVVDHFDGTRWRPVPAPPLPFEIGGFTTWSGDEVLVWTTDPARPTTKAIVAYDPAAGRWSIAGRTAQAPTEVVPADDRLVLYTFGAVSMSFDSIER